MAKALDRVEPVGGRVFDALTSPTSSVPGSVVPRLGAAFAVMTTPVVLVLDDVHLLHDSEGRAALSVLADHVPAGSRLVIQIHYTATGAPQEDQCSIGLVFADPKTVRKEVVTDMVVNPRAPLVVHEGLGHQVLNAAPGANLQAPLFPATGSEQSPSVDAA